MVNTLHKYSDIPENLNELSGQIVDCAFQVHKELGPGFTEQIYEDAFVKELSFKGLSFERQKSFKIFYKDGYLPTEFRFDLVVENNILIELKAIEKIHSVHQAQIYAYLKATGFPIGLLINFNVDLIKNGIGRYKNKYSGSSGLRV
jgi:GxxExxY protein